MLLQLTNLHHCSLGAVPTLFTERKPALLKQLHLAAGGCQQLLCGGELGGSTAQTASQSGELLLLVGQRAGNLVDVAVNPLILTVRRQHHCLYPPGHLFEQRAIVSSALAINDLLQNDQLTAIDVDVYRPKFLISHSVFY